MAKPKPVEVRDAVRNTADMDWPAWGADLKMAVDEFAAAIILGWPHASQQVRAITTRFQAGDIPADDAFGMLQDVANSRGG